MLGSTAVLVSDPTLPFAVSSAVWFSVPSTEHVPEGTRTDFYGFDLPPEYSLADPSRSTAVIRLLSWTSLPYSAHQPRRSTFRQVSKPVFVPPSGFGYPLDGLLPPKPSRCTTPPAALLGFVLRSSTRSPGIPAFPLECTHMPFIPNLMPGFGQARRFGLRLLGFDPCGKPWRPAVPEVRLCQVAPLDFSFPGFVGHLPCCSFRNDSSHVLNHDNRRNGHLSMHFGVSIGWCLVADRGRITTLSATTLLRFLHLPVPEHLDLNTPGYEFTSSEVRHY
jgi:hypothetical protein